ncbi:Kelch-like protein 34 [Myotis davidii]|uniref:Kelch-like protein 34 n=1 Tax=Myotis davidii TaxID=225400 RepID=L5MI80_MYODS|nr:Kelch-like protein 34 [Myotis davidii]
MVPQGAARGRGAAAEPEEEVAEEGEQVEEGEEEDEDWELTQDVVAFDVYNHGWRSLTQLPAPLLGHSDIDCALPWAWSGLQCAVLQLPEGADEEREGETGENGETPDVVLGLTG